MQSFNLLQLDIIKSLAFAIVIPYKQRHVSMCLLTGMLLLSIHEIEIALASDTVLRVGVPQPFDAINRSYIAINCIPTAGIRLNDFWAPLRRTNWIYLSQLSKTLEERFLLREPRSFIVMIRPPLVGPMWWGDHLTEWHYNNISDPRERVSVKERFSLLSDPSRIPTLQRALETAGDLVCAEVAGLTEKAMLRLEISRIARDAEVYLQSVDLMVPQSLFRE